MSLGSASNFFLGAASAGSGPASGPIKSVRFNSADSTNLSRTFAAGNRQTFTLSWWMKRCVLDESNKRIFGKSTGSQQFSIMHNSAGQLYTYFNLDSPTDVSTQTFDPQYRDPSAWAHYVLAFDTTQSTDSDRIKFYYNGVQITDFASTPNWPTQNASFKWNNASDTYYIGGISSYYINAYLADMYHVDGQQLDCTSFGAFDNNGVWQAAEYSGTYGTNGFHLFDFANESGIGDDSSGNDNDWTVNNIVGPGNGTKYRTLELSVNHASGVISQPNNTFDATRIATYVNTDTWAITNTAWLGSYANGYAEARWIPVGGYAVSSSLRIYFGVYSNVSRRSTLTVTYTDSTTESSSEFSSGINNWMTLFTASNAAGKTIQKVEISNPDTTNIQFGGFVIDDAIVESLNVDTDVLFDVPKNNTQTDTGAGGEVSGNYSILNSLQYNSGSSITLSQGNLVVNTGATATWNTTGSTIAVSSGKWLCEVTINTVGTYTSFGVSNPASVDVDYYMGVAADSYTWFAYDGGGIYTNGAYTDQTAPWGSSSGTFPAANDVVGMALDMDAGTLKYYINGSLVGTAFTGITGPVVFCDGSYDSSVHTYNFGQRDFAYPVSGYKALCTKNLPTPTVPQGSDYFDALTWTGDGTGSRSFTGLSFQPDFTWVKIRTQSYTHTLFDSVRGAGSNKELSSDTTGTEGSANTSLYGYLSSFDSTGFSSTEGTSDNDFFNRLNDTYIAWNWDAGTSTESNTDGTITSQVRANQSAGFSIFTFTGNGVEGATVGHGLGVAPDFVIQKSTTVGNYWAVYHSSLGIGSFLRLDLTLAAAGEGNYWNSFSSTVFNLAGEGSTLNNVNNDGEDYVALAFSEVEGFSKFGTYDGNGSNTDGPFIYLGFRPAFFLLKMTTTNGYNWHIFDSTRSSFNVVNDALRPNLDDAEVADYGSANILFCANGVKLNANWLNLNRDGDTFAYAAFAEHPLQANGGLAR